MKMLALLAVCFVGCVAPKPVRPTSSLMSRATVYDAYWQPQTVQFQGETWDVTGHHYQFGYMILHLQRGAMTQNVSATSVQ